MRRWNLKAQFEVRGSFHQSGEGAVAAGLAPKGILIGELTRYDSALGLSPAYRIFFRFSPRVFVKLLHLSTYRPIRGYSIRPVLIIVGLLGHPALPAYSALGASCT